MKRLFLIVSLALLTLRSVSGFTPPPIPTGLQPQVIVDAKTKITFYLESDRRHISAISTDGKLLWCCEVVPEARKTRCYIMAIGYFPPGSFYPVPGIKDDRLDVSIFVGGHGWGSIDKQTGVFKQDPVVQ